MHWEEFGRIVHFAGRGHAKGSLSGCEQIYPIDRFERELRIDSTKRLIHRRHVMGRSFVITTLPRSYNRQVRDPGVTMISVSRSLTPPFSP